MGWLGLSGSDWLGIGGSVVSAGASLLSSKNEADRQEANATEVNRAAVEESKYQLYRGKADAEKKMENVKKLIAKGNLAFSKSGVRMSSASVQDVFRENMQEGLYDAEMIRKDSEYKAENIRRGGAASVRDYKTSADNATWQGYAQAGSSLLTAAGKFF